jgi:lipopolysaccharide export system protein LptA
MRMFGWMVAVLWLLPAARAQETTVMPPPAMAPTGTVKAAKPPKNPANSLFTPAAGSSTNGMTISFDRLEFDYKDMVAAYDGHVRVVDPRYEMTCDRMLVFLEGTNQIKRIIAVGNVDMTQTDRHATCGRAVYEHTTGQAELTGNPVVTQGGNRLVGTRILIWLNDQRVEVDSGRMNLAPETVKNRDIKP